MFLPRIRSRHFPDMTVFRLFTRFLAFKELPADTAGRFAAAALFARKAQEKIGNPAKLPPPLAAATLLAREKGYGHYKLTPMAGTGLNSTLQWTGRLKRSISSGNVALRESGAGSDDPKAVYHELGPQGGKGPPKRSFLASTAQEFDKEAFMLYAETLIKTLFNI